MLHMAAGIAPAVRRELLLALTDATVESLAAPRGSVRIHLVELPAAAIACAGVPLDEAGPDAADPLGGPTVLAHLVAGRGEEKKAAFIAAVTATAARVLGIAPAPIRVIVVDVPTTDFGIGGATAKSLGR